MSFPAHRNVPELPDSYDDGDWVALLLEDCVLSGSEVSALEFFRTDPALADRDPADLVSLMASAAMTFAARSADAAPPGLPTMPALRARWAENLRHELDRLL